MSCPLCAGPHGVDTCPRAAAGQLAGSTLALGAPAITPLPELAQPLDPLVGQTVGSFRVIRPLGRGGMGTVYLAEHPVIGSRVAIKFLHEAMASSAELVGRFYDEARAVNLIGHENIVGIFDLSVLPPARYYIVMEYLDGETLTARVRRGEVPLAVGLDILLQLCDALHCAHERGVIHRDLKPDNVFLVKRRGKDHFVKLVDFGIAKLRDAPPGAKHTAAGMIVGTPEYMAPEQCDNRGVDARTDLYALGVMAYELAVGRLPFAGRSITQLLLAHLKEPPEPPRKLNASVPPALEAAILKALSKKPEDRFPDMAAFGAALAGVLDELSAPARPEPAPAAPAPAAPSPAAAPPPPVPLWQAEVRAAEGGAPRRLTASEISRGGLYLRAEGWLPPMFARVQVALERPAEPPLELLAEVVRQVSPQDAAAWRMSPGFAVQFVDISADQRAALSRLVDGARQGQAPRTPAPGEAAGDAAAVALVRDLRSRSSGSHYDLLGVQPDVEFTEVRSRAKALRAQLEALRGRALPAEEAKQVGPLLERVEAAAAVLATPAERLAYDARRGNHLGVARCVASGLAVPLVETRRREFLAERPGAEEEAQKHFVRAKVARAMGNDPAARAEYEAALTSDPLNLAIQQAYWTLKREGAGAEQSG
ncbi:MAG TPA: serine/threonine-protein kinase [Anaeromyxobacteraceae bacterium]|nr:serine/threonine-protein kinase [Anaeromyxobacteraceae bacterium]